MPIDRGIIDQQLRALGESPAWWEQREFRDLPTVLDADERILALSRGKVARLRWLRRNWLIVVTDRRLVCIRSAGRTGWRQMELGASQITRVALRIGLVRGRVLVVGGGRTCRLLVSRADGYKLSTALSTLSTPAQEFHAGFRPTAMARRVLDHVLALPAVALGPEPPKSKPAIPAVPLATRERIQTLEDEVQELRDQVHFLEQLLHRQQVGPGVEKRLPPS